MFNNLKNYIFELNGKSTILAAFLLCLAFAFSFFYSEINSGFLFVSYVFLIGSLYLQIKNNFNNNHYYYSHNLFVVFLILFWLLMLFSLFNSVYFLKSYAQFWTLTVFPLTFFTCIFQKNKLFIKYVITFFITIIIFVSLWALYDIIFKTIENRFRASGPFENPNSLAGLLNLALFLITAKYLTYRPDDKIKVILYYLVFLIVCAAMVATMSRGGIISAFICLILLFIMLNNHEHFSIKKYFIVITSSTILYLIFRVFLYSFRDNAPLAEKTMGARFLIWEKSLEMIQAKPLQGWGLATFEYVYPQYRHHYAWGKDYYVHMDPLQFAVEMGIIAPVLFYSMLLAGMIYTIRALKKLKKSSHHIIYITGSFCAVCALIIHTHITYHFYNMPTLYMLGLVCASWQYVSTKALNKNKRIELSYNTKKFMLITLGIFSIIALHGTSIDYITKRIYNYSNKSLNDFNYNDYPQLQSYINFANLYSLGQDPNAYLHLANLQTRLILNPSLSIEHKKILVKSILEMYQKAETLNGYDPKIPYNIGLFYDKMPEELINNKKEKSIEKWQKAIHLNPRYKPAQKKLEELLTINNE